MLAPLGYKLLSNKALVPTMQMRFLMRLLAGFDLRSYVCLNPSALALLFKMNHRNVNISLDSLCKAGILERGPILNFAQTFRLRPAVVLNKEALERHCLEIKEQQERLNMAPRASRVEVQAHSPREVVPETCKTDTDSPASE